MKKLKIMKPSYWPRFKCIASACSDNCCIGWEVDIDPETRERYRKADGEFGKTLAGGIIDTPEGSMFRLMGREERCAFLDEKNLCKIQIHLGESFLCEICREHPRYYEWLGDTTEAGIGMCCEAAARLILGRTEKDSFYEEETEGEPDTLCYDEEWRREVTAIREEIFLILTDRRFPVWERIEKSLDAIIMLGDPEDTLLGNRIKPADGRGKLEQSKESRENIKNLLEFLITLEPMSEDWHPALSRLRDRLDSLLAARTAFRQASRAWEYEYEHLAVYYLYRYAIKAVYDGDLESKIFLMAASVEIQELLDTDAWLKERERESSQKDAHKPENDNDARCKEYRGCGFADNFARQAKLRAAHARKYSKEIEYNEDNMQRFQEYLRMLAYVRLGREGINVS